MLNLIIIEFDHQKGLNPIQSEKSCLRNSRGFIVNPRKLIKDERESRDAIEP